MPVGIFSEHNDQTDSKSTKITVGMFQNYKN